MWTVPAGPAAQAFGPWRRTTPSERSLALIRIADAIAKQGEELVGSSARNTGSRSS